MLDIMYDLPYTPEITHYTITWEMVEKHSTAQLLVHPRSFVKLESA